MPRRTPYAAAPAAASGEPDPLRVADVRFEPSLDGLDGVVHGSLHECHVEKTRTAWTLGGHGLQRHVIPIGHGIGTR